jgi:Beta-galactosidase
LTVAPTCDGRFHVTLLLHQWDLLNPACDLKRIKEAGVTHITFPLMWRRIEVEKGVFDFSFYDDLIRRISDAHLEPILILDAGGRWNFDDKGEVQYGVTVYPDWFYSHHEFFSYDFYGQQTTQMSFVCEPAWDLVEAFYQAVVNHYSGWEKIYGFAIGLQGELEIKYGQVGYCWRDYSPGMKEAFKTESGLDPPILDFPRSINSAQEPMHGFDRWMSFREDVLKAVVERLAKVIRQSGSRALGYFGEVFSSHDAISATGVIADLSGCLSGIIVDYNFFDGWRLTTDIWKVPLMANYAKMLGYQQVFGGFYVERWCEPIGKVEARINPRIVPIVARSIQECRTYGSIEGIEIGGFGNVHRDVGEFQSIMLQGAITPRTTSNERVRSQVVVGLLASHATFNWFIGENSYDRNIHSDALTRSYELLSAVPGFRVVIISDKLVSDRPHVLDDIDVIYVPHQPVLSARARAALRVFALKETKLLVQDVRYGEWTADGVPLGGWSNDLFGIAGIGWRSTGGTFTYRGDTVLMPGQSRLYASYALLAAKPGGNILMNAEGDAGGLLLLYRNTMTVGYIPALIEGPNSEFWRDTFLEEMTLQVHRNRRVPC